MMKRCALVAAIVAGCGGAPKPAAAPAPAPAPAAAPASASPLTIAELCFYEGDEEGMALHADGRFEVKATHSEAGQPAQETWLPVARLSADGTLAKPDGGVVGKLGTDGTFTSADGQHVAPFRIDGETLVIGDKHVTFDAQGVLQGGDPASHLRVTGLTDVGSRRAALLLLAVVLADAHAAAAAAPAAP